MADVYYQQEKKRPNSSSSICQSESNGSHKAKRSYSDDSPSSSPEQSSAAEEGYHKPLVGVKSLCKIYNGPFQELVEAVEQSGGQLTEQVYAVLCDPLYNTR